MAYDKYCHIDKLTSHLLNMDSISMQISCLLHLLMTVWEAAIKIGSIPPFNLWFFSSLFCLWKCQAHAIGQKMVFSKIATAEFCNPGLPQVDNSHAADCIRPFLRFVSIPFKRKTQYLLIQWAFGIVIISCFCFLFQNTAWVILWYICECQFQTSNIHLGPFWGEYQDQENFRSLAKIHDEDWATFNQTD